MTAYESDGIFVGNDFQWIVPRQTTQSGQMSGISLIDSANHQRYLVLKDAEGECLCTQYTPFTLQRRHLMMVYAYFPAPPQDVDSLTVEFPLAQLFFDVPLEKVQKPADLPERLPGGERQPTRRPSEVNAERETIPLISRNLDGDSGASQRKGSEQKIHLSAKVLFDLNKATLRDTAKAELRDVADKIDGAAPETVRIDGHTDSSGDPSINEPLSRDRAQAVRDALSQMVKRDGVEYVAEGHGANDPIADNDTAEGRQKNRRVTIAFSG